MTSKTTNKFSPEVRARAVRMVLDHEAEHPARCRLSRIVSPSTASPASDRNRAEIRFSFPYGAPVPSRTKAASPR